MIMEAPRCGATVCRTWTLAVDAMGKLILQPDCEYCGRLFSKKNKRALRVLFGKGPKKLNKCKKCEQRNVKFTLRLGLLQDAKRRLADDANADEADLGTIG